LGATYEAFDIRLISRCVSHSRPSAALIRHSLNRLPSHGHAATLEGDHVPTSGTSSIMRTSLVLSLFAAMLASPYLRADTSDAARDYERIVKPFFAAHCLKCHGETKPKGDFRLDNLPIDLTVPKNATHWTDIFDRINAGTMPPVSRPRPN